MTHEAHPSNCRSPDRKCCSGCGETKPLDEFRRKRRGCERRESRCNLCHRNYMKWYCRNRREKALLGFAKQAKWRTDVEYLAALVRALTERFGGLEEFARSYSEFFRKLASDPRSSKQASDGYLAMVRLLQTLAKEQQINVE